MTNLNPSIYEAIVYTLKSNFAPRDLQLMLNCITYSQNDPAGFPGHNLMLLVAALLKMTTISEHTLNASLDRITIQEAIRLEFTDTEGRYV